MILVGVGASQSLDSQIAIREACDQAILPLKGHPPTIIILFASPTKYDQQLLLNYLKHHHSQANIVGCSSSGEISNYGTFDNSLTLMAIYSDTMHPIAAVAHNFHHNPREAGKTLAQELIKANANQPPQAALIFPDGLAGNGADIVRGITDIFGPDIPLAGGSAGDDFQFKQTFQYHDRSVHTDSIVSLGLTGEFTLGIGVRHGWIPIGLSRTVTKAKDNIIYELDGKPAIEIYEEQFGKDKIHLTTDEPFAQFAITYPLGIVQASQKEYIIRDPLSADEQGAITCAAEVPEGSEVYIMIGGRDEAIAAASIAAQQAKQQIGEKTPKAIILFNCIGRKKLLMHKRQEEIDKIQNIIGKDIPLIGFYTYGEQAPYGEDVISCSFHNETDVICILAE